MAMRAGFLLDRIVAADRNRGLAASHRLPGGRVFSRNTAAQTFPGLRRQGLTGAAVFYDYVTTEPDRLTFSFAHAAVEHGAVLVNHLEATAPRVDGRRVTGISARDTIGSRTIDVAARMTINATGGRVDALLKPLGITTGIPMLKAMNLVTRRDAGDEALGGRSRSGRNLFLVPWRERALFGTWESERPCDPEDTTVTEHEVTAFMSELNQAFPALDLTMDDVTLVHRGVVPAAVKGDQIGLEGHEQIRDHAAQGFDGLLTVAGTKFTTARGVAERVVNTVMSKLQQKPVPCRTATTPLPGGSLRDIGLAIADARREFDEGLPTDTIPHLIAAYGSRYRDVMEIAGTRSDWRTRLAPDSPVIGAELVLAARKEMAPTLADAVIRRTPLGALGYPGDPALDRAAAIVGGELGWSDERRRDEITAVTRFYRDSITR
jgi:glycerol-3-phosphate dehydrogenase